MNDKLFISNKKCLPAYSNCSSHYLTTGHLMLTIPFFSQIHHSSASKFFDLYFRYWYLNLQLSNKKVIR